MGVFNTLFGGGGKEGASWIEHQTGVGAANTLGNRSGAKFKGYDKTGAPIYDYTEVGKNPTVAQASEGYDFSPMDQAIKGFKKPSLFNQTYSPYQFNYNDPTTLNQYASNQYALGAKDINRAGQSNLKQIQEATGTRRPGLLMKAGEANGRNVGEQLATLQSQLRGDVLGKQIDLNKSMQEAQAGEGYKGYQSRSDLEKANSDERFRNLGALAETGKSKIGAQAGLQTMAQANQDKNLDALMQLYLQTRGQRYGINSSSGGGGGVLGTAANIASKVAPFFL